MLKRLRKPSLWRPLDYMKRVMDRRFVGIQLDTSPPKLLNESGMLVGDVLFCRGDKRNYSWRLISYGSSGHYVHAAIYIGNGTIVESTTRGVQSCDLQTFIDRYPYVAVARCPGVYGIPTLQSKVVEYCKKHVRARTRYSFAGALFSPLLEFVELVIGASCRRPNKIRRHRVRNKTFCSEFVLQAFVYGGYFSDEDAGHMARSPTALAEENCFSLEGYLSNSSSLPRLVKDDIFWSGGG